jgi:hypothetical protein
MEVLKDVYTHALEEERLVAFKKFSLSERMIKRGLDILGSLVGSFLFVIVATLLYVPYRICSKKIMDRCSINKNDMVKKVKSFIF